MFTTSSLDQLKISFALQRSEAQILYQGPDITTALYADAKFVRNQIQVGNYLTFL